MNSLKNQLKNQIPVLQNDIKKLISDKGDQKISEVTVAQAYSGLRGIKAFVCDTSSVSAEKGLIIRGIPLLEMTDVLPEEVFYLLLTGDLPNESELKELQEEFSEHLSVPEYVWNILNEMPKETHPMTMFNTGILAMFGTTNNSMIRILKPILLTFCKTNAVKKLILDLLKALVKTTDNTIEDKIVEMIETKLWPSL